MPHVERRLRNDRVTWLARWRDPDGRQRKKSFARKLDAERHLVTVASAMLTGTYIDPRAGRVTVAEYAETWLANKGHLKPKTRTGYESLLLTRVLPQWGLVPLDRVSYGGVSSWVTTMTGAGLSASRTRQAYHVLKSLLDEAVKDARLLRNPALGVDLPRLPASERRYLTHVQVNTLAEACKRHRTLVLVLAYCGIRWGEATALRVARVDPARGRLEIVEAVVEVNGAMIFGSPKTHQHRSVPIPKFLRADLLSATAAKSPGDLVFPSATGSALRVQNFRRDVFDRAAREAGLPGLTPHELRHTAASLAIASGASIKGVQSMLGHATATLTLDRYGHLFEGELDAVGDRLDAARAEALGPPVRPRMRDLGTEG